MNNKGFTLIEILATLTLIAIVLGVAVSVVKPTMSAGKKESYELMKNNIVSVSYDYISECKLGTIKCDFDFDTNNTFSIIELKNTGFIKSLESPIDGKDLGKCLEIRATKSNGVVVVDLIDNCYL